jgi:hypothetical protein
MITRSTSNNAQEEEEEEEGGSMEDMGMKEEGGTSGTPREGEGVV